MIPLYDDLIVRERQVALAPTPTQLCLLLYLWLCVLDPAICRCWCHCSDNRANGEMPLGMYLVVVADWVVATLEIAWLLLTVI